MALQVFRYQQQSVPVYKKYLELLGRENFEPSHYSQIPFLPISFFKNHVITDCTEIPGLVFSSSGTTGQEPSKHYVADASIYHQSLLKGFELFYGDPSQYCFLALLPSYLERGGSSLVYMAQELINRSGHPQSGFYLNDFDALARTLEEVRKRDEKIFLLGVTYALLDFFDAWPLRLEHTILMETGGMKGRRKELVKQELHEKLKTVTGLTSIHSEYGMTELLSQAYSKGDGIFECPPWMKILAGDIHDPFSHVGSGETGIIKVIDLANLHSCAFIETRDLGRTTDEQSFEVLGRMDHSEWRGCNLMVP